MGTAWFLEDMEKTHSLANGWLHSEWCNHPYAIFSLADAHLKMVT
jgi:hypothetical protein